MTVKRGNEDTPGHRALARREFDWSETRPSVGVVLVLSDLSPPVLSQDQGPRLADYLDPDALDEVVTNASDETTVYATVRDCRVRVTNRAVSVWGPQSASD